MRNRAGIGDGVYRTHEGERGDQDFVAGLDTGQPKARMQGDGAVGHRDRARRSGERGEIALEAVHELAGRRHPPGLDAFAQVGDLIAFEEGIVQRLRQVGIGGGGAGSADHAVGEGITRHTA